MLEVGFSSFTILLIDWSESRGKCLSHFDERTGDVDRAVHL